VASSYSDVIEKIIRKMLESSRCVKKAEVVEAAKAEVETSPDALRVLVNRVLKRLAKRGEIYIFDTEICRGVHISHEVVKALEVWHTPHDLSILFKIVMDMVKRGGRLDDFVFETLASAADAALKDGKSVGVVYKPSDIGDAILALAIFKLFRKWYSDTRGKGLAAVYLTLPMNDVMDLLQARPHVDEHKKRCVVKCYSCASQYLFEDLLKDPSSLKYLEAVKDVGDVVVIGRSADGSGYHPEYIITLPSGGGGERFSFRESCRRTDKWLGSITVATVTYFIEEFTVAKLSVETRGKKYFLYETPVRHERYLVGARGEKRKEYYERGITSVFDNTEECWKECPPETQSQRLDSNIIGELAKILQLLNDHMDYMRRLLALAIYIRIIPEKVSRSEQL
jgi:hypothetical protein